MIKIIEIVADYREKNSEMPVMLMRQGDVYLKWDRLACVDYKLTYSCSCSKVGLPVAGL